MKGILSSFIASARVDSLFLLFELKRLFFSIKSYLEERKIVSDFYFWIRQFSPWEWKIECSISIGIELLVQFVWSGCEVCTIYEVWLLDVRNFCTISATTPLHNTSPAPFRLQPWISCLERSPNAVQRSALNDLHFNLLIVV